MLKPGQPFSFPTFTTLKTLINQSLYPQALKSSTFLQNPQLTDSIYSLFIKSGFILDQFLAASLITHFSSSADFPRASQLLHDTLNPDTVVYNSLICGYARFGQSEPAFELFNGLRQVGLKPDVYTSSSLIKCCENFKQNEIAHGVFVKLGFVDSVFVVSGLVENYSKLGFFGEAEKCFDECLVLDSVVWTAMINGYVWNGEFKMGRDVFMAMRGLGLGVNEFSLTSVIGGLFDAKEGGQIHGYGVKMGYLYGRSTHLSNALINMYCRCGCKTDAVKVFDELPNPDVVSWTGRIDAAYDAAAAFELFKLCISRGLEINEYTIITILSSIEGPEMLKPGKQIHALSYKAGYMFAVPVYNVLISMYGKSWIMDDAKRAFDEMICRDSVSWNSLITGYTENGLGTQAIAVFSQMCNDSLKPNKYTLASILEVASSSKSPEQLMQIHSIIIKLGFISDDSMQCCLLTAYGKCNAIDESKRVFNEINKVESVHLNAMAGTFAHAGCHVDVLHLFQTRWNSSLEVDSITLSIVLKACGLLTDLDQGRVIHSLTLKSGLVIDNFIASAIIDVYCKCGSLDDAQKTFRNIAKDNLAAWNAMMMGYAQYGSYDEVCYLLDKMPKFGVKPDEITYLGVLSACCHAGLVNKAQYHLNSMFNLHGVIPCLEHYACLVDGLGRVGLLEEARSSIDQMPILPDARIWQILLSACNVHGNVDLGKFAARRLVELQPENESAFVLLSNLYASAGMWNDVGELRMEMKERIVCKEPGSSWILT
ncbi:hypothetical protein LguiA_015693 [Lonicera macranthoides]